MCSIAGNFNSKLTLQEYKNLNKKMAHRGLDGSEVKEFDFLDSRIFLAHNRLSIQDLSLDGTQPMQSDNFVIVFNGEIYNHKDIRAELKREDFSSSSDTQTILYAFEEWGVEKTIKKLNGMFAIGLFDKQKNRLFLIRDRIGIKPLYYTLQNKEFAFASTPKGLPKHLIEKESKKAIIQLMSLTYIPSTNCYFDGVKKVGAGEYICFDGATVKTFKYWDIPNEKLDLSYLKSLEKTEDLIEKAVKRRLLADVEVGTFLSGGVDSSLVTAIASKYSNKKIKTFSMGFEEKGYDESIYAEEISKILKTDHHKFIFRADDVLSLLDDYREAYDEPFGDASSLPMMLLSKQTAKYIKVALSGDGGDELFLGYQRYFFTNDYYNRFNKIPKFIRDPLSGLFNLTSSDKLNKISYPLRNLTPENLYSVISTAVKPWEIDSIFSKEFLGDEKFLYSDLLEFDQKIETIAIMENLSHIDQKRYLPDDILTKVDRASMFYTLEARVPLLDHTVIEFANKIPLKHRQNKKILKAILAKYIPQNLINRPKRGFSVPLKKWFREDLKELLFDKINSLDERFNKEHILKLFNEHQKGKNYEYIFWNLLQVK